MILNKANKENRMTKAIGSTAKVLRVTDWETHYENNRTRDMKNMQWVPVPNKHDGYGYCLLVSENGAARLGAWVAILQTAAKSHPRGTLLRDGKHAHTAKTIAVKTRLEESAIQETIIECLRPEIGWLELVDIKGVTGLGAGIPQEGAEIPQEPARKGREGNRKEENSYAASGEGESYDDSSISKPSSRFKKPTVPEVGAYVKERVASGAAQIDAGAFCDFYDSKGWKVGKTPMKDWKAAVRTWQNKRREDEPKSRPMRGF